MLITISEIKPFIKNIKGIIHIGAHECEERESYIRELNINDNKTLWFEANERKVNEM